MKEKPVNYKVTPIGVAVFYLKLALSERQYQNYIDNVLSQENNCHSEREVSKILSLHFRCFILKWRYAL
jgi:hypothetical protein